MSQSAIKSLQIGMHWFPEREGGLDRMYYSLVNALPGAGVSVRGMVAGSPRVEHDTDGAIRGFGSAALALPLRLMAAQGVRARDQRRAARCHLVAFRALYVAWARCGARHRAGFAFSGAVG